MQWLIGLQWLLGTSVMPLCVGAGIGLVSRRVLGAGSAGAARRAGIAAAAAWAAHLLLVGAGLLRDGAMFDYAAVLLAAVAASWLLALRR